MAKLKSALVYLLENPNPVYLVLFIGSIFATWGTPWVALAIAGAAWSAFDLTIGHKKKKGDSGEKE